MNTQIGKVKEVFIPSKEDLFNNFMSSNLIGFKIIINEEELTIIEEQDDLNSKILKEDFVIIKTTIIDNKEFIDIEKYEEDIYEQL